MGSPPSCSKYRIAQNVRETCYLQNATVDCSATCTVVTDCLCRFIYSGSEDKSVCVWDRRAHKLLQRIKVHVMSGDLMYSSLMHLYIVEEAYSIAVFGL